MVIKLLYCKHEILYGIKLVMSLFLRTIITFGTGCMMIALFIYHFNILLLNKTTLEDMKEPVFIDPNFTYDLGAGENFAAVFGDNCCLWFFPVETATTNGTDFPVNIHSY